MYRKQNPNQLRLEKNSGARGDLEMERTKQQMQRAGEAFASFSHTINTSVPGKHVSRVAVHEREPYSISSLGPLATFVVNFEVD